MAKAAVNFTGDGAKLGYEQITEDGISSPAIKTKQLDPWPEPYEKGNPWQYEGYPNIGIFFVYGVSV
jgi:hypothetical protein